jgi:hypothetical protein
MTNRFEYKVHLVVVDDIQSTDYPAIERELNLMGASGWELVKFESMGQMSYRIYKRQLQ